MGCRGGQQPLCNIPTIVVGAYLGNSLVVDVDQVAGGGVDLEGLVKSEGALDHLGGCGRADKFEVSVWRWAEALTICAKGLALLDLLQEVGLLFVGRGREALILCVVNGCPHGLPLGLLFGDGLILVNPRHAPLVAPKLSPELGGRTTAVVKVDCVG